MAMCYYILDDDKNPLPVEDFLTWAAFFENPANRQVGRDEIGESTVTTVFLGINHNWGFEDPRPVLFETMVFGGSLDGEQDRCCTWQEAEAMHKAMCERVRATVAAGSN